MTSRWPFLTCTPASSVSSSAVRWNAETGVAQRMISSAAVDGRELRILTTGHLVGPAEQLVAVFLRDAEEAGDRLQRQLAADLLDEVAATLGRGRLCDVLGALGELFLEPADGTRGEAAGD